MRYLYVFLISVLCCTTVRAQTLSFTRYDLFPGTVGSSTPSDFISLNGKMLFVAKSAGTGRELWISDGTATGTKLLKDILPGGKDANPAYMTEYKGKIYFSANDDVNGTELWVTDGTEAGTQLVMDINVGIPSSYPANFIIYKDKLYFTAEKTNVGSYSLWVTDGTTKGTKLAADIYLGGITVNAQICVANNKLFFTAHDNSHGNELWVSDGTDSGTHMVRDINPGSAPGNVYQLTPFKNTLYFMANTPAQGNELWVSDGTTAGTHIFKDICNSTFIGGNSGLYGIGPVYNGRLYLSASDCSYGAELWSTDGTDSGTAMLRDINVGSLGSSPDNWCISNDKLYFTAGNVQMGRELWVTDGSGAGTKLVKDVYKGNQSGGPNHIINFAGKVFFAAKQDTGGMQLFMTDGTDAGTQLLKPAAVVNNNALDSTMGFSGFFEYMNHLYFAAKYDDAGSELWSLGDSTITTAISSVSNSKTFSIYPNPNNGNFIIDIPYLDADNNVLTVYAVTGRQVYRRQLITNTTTVQTNGLAPGVYLIKLQTGQQISTTRMLVQ